MVPSHPLGPRPHLHGGAGGPSLVERAPALPAVDRVLHFHAQLPGHCDLVVVLDVLQCNAIVSSNDIRIGENLDNPMQYVRVASSVEGNVIFLESLCGGRYNDRISPVAKKGIHAYSAGCADKYAFL